MHNSDQAVDIQREPEVTKMATEGKAGAVQLTLMEAWARELKRKQLHFLTRYEGVAPKLVLLSLLAECCTATLTSTLHSLAEVGET